MCRCSSCELPCAIAAGLPRISTAGGRMHRDVGEITGAAIGNSAEASGTDGTAGLPRRVLRCLPTSGSILGIGIPDKLSSGTSFNSRNTVTSRVTPSCGNTIRSGAEVRAKVRARARVRIGIGIAIIKTSRAALLPGRARCRCD